MKLKAKIQKAIDSNDEEALQEFGGTSNGFWYDLTSGGYFKPEKVLADKVDIKRAKDALAVMKELEQIYEQLTPEF